MITPTLSFHWHAVARAAALAAVLGASAAGASAALRYSNVTTEVAAQESWTGNSMVQPSGGGFASVDQTGLDLQVADSTHWVGGPSTAAIWHRQFGIAGAAGTFETVSVTFDVSARYGNDQAADFVASHDLELSLIGDSGSGGWVRGGLVEVNCIGCGGHIGGGTLSHSDGTSAAWPHTLQATYTFSAVVERGLEQAGAVRMSGALGVGSTWADLSIHLRSITDSQGQVFTWGQDDGFLAPVPEPATTALWLAGIGLLGALARRRHG